MSFPPNYEREPGGNDATWDCCEGCGAEITLFDIREEFDQFLFVAPPAISFVVSARWAERHVKYNVTACGPACEAKAEAFAQAELARELVEGRATFLAFRREPSVLVPPPPTKAPHCFRVMPTGDVRPVNGSPSKPEK